MLKNKTIKTKFVIWNPPLANPNLSFSELIWASKIIEFEDPVYYVNMMAVSCMHLANLGLSALFTIHHRLSIVVQHRYSGLLAKRGELQSQHLFLTQ